jgi:hypothetical protein
MFAAIFNTLKNCFKIPELKSRLLFTLLLLGVCRLASLVPVPGLNSADLKEYLGKSSGGGGNSLVGMYSLFTGGGFENCAVGALGIMPYISATIIIQLLTAFIPSLSKLAREEGGRVKLIQFGRYLTVLLCLGQGVLMALTWENPDKLFPGFGGKLLASTLQSTALRPHPDIGPEPLTQPEFHLPCEPELNWRVWIAHSTYGSSSITPWRTYALACNLTWLAFGRLSKHDRISVSRLGALMRLGGKRRARILEINHCFR